MVSSGWVGNEEFAVISESDVDLEEFAGPLVLLEEACDVLGALLSVEACCLCS